MKKTDPTQDMHDDELFCELEKIYRQHSKELPNSAIDKQIIAAANAELMSPNPRNKLKTSWWRRLSLPLYVTATFTFTALAAHWFWPAPVRIAPGTSPSPTMINLSEPGIVDLEMPKRQPRKMPDAESLIEPPQTEKKSFEATQGEVLIDAAERQRKLDQQLHSKSVVSLPSKQTTAVNSAKEATKNVAKLSFQDREEWARKIIELFKKSEFEQAQGELVRFKKAYPDYPIDEQIKVFHQ